MIINRWHIPPSSLTSQISMHESVQDFTNLHERMQQLQAKSQAGVLTTLESGEMKKLVSAIARRNAQVWCYGFVEQIYYHACILFFLRKRVY